MTVLLEDATRSHPASADWAGARLHANAPHDSSKVVAVRSTQRRLAMLLLVGLVDALSHGLRRLLMR